MAESKKLLALLHKIAAEQNLENYDLKVTPITSGGANFTSQLFSATISAKSRQELNLFAKIAAWGEKLRSEWPKNIFDVERLVYTDLKDIYRQLEDKHGVEDKHRLRMPIMYGCDISPPDEVVVMEDLASQGFTTYERTESITWEYGKAAITELAKLHALSMAFEREYPEKYKNMSNNFGSIDESIENTQVLWKNTQQMALKAVSEENRERLRIFLKQTDNYAAQFKPIKKEVFVHGDFRVSNMMHRYRTDGSVELVPLDYQTLGKGCPMIDLYYFIFTGTDREFRSRYYKQLVEHYYSELRAALTRLGLDPDREYSRGDFEFELKEKLPLGLAVAVMMLPIITVEAKNAPKVDEEMELSALGAMETGEQYPVRLNEVVEDFIKMEVLVNKICL